MTKINTTSRSHSPECEAEHAAAIAGWRFVKEAPSVGPVALRFPLALRKMWSGAEVQRWLDELPPLFTAQPDAEALRKRVAELEALSVTNILIDMVPSGPTGSDVFDKVFASSCEDIYAVFNRLDDKAETLELERDEARARADRMKCLLDESRDSSDRLRAALIEISIDCKDSEYAEVARAALAARKEV